MPAPRPVRRTQGTRKRLDSTGQGPLTPAMDARTPEHCLGCLTLGRALKALLRGVWAARSARLAELGWP